MSQKIALVTGANRGIGLELSKQLAQAGFRVITAARTAEKAQAAAKAVGHDAVPATLEATNPAHIHGIVQQITESFGHLDVLVNNAGAIFEPSFMLTNADTLDADTLRKTFDVNFFAPIALTQALLPLLESSEGARIINMSSVLGSLTTLAASPGMGCFALGYNASKAALNMFTITLEAAVKDKNIKVFSAHPGWVKTEMGGDAAPLTLAEGAQTALELATGEDASPGGSFRHLGQTLPW